MEENNVNAWCSICGKGYRVCNTCLEQKTFKPWRTVTDSIEHYKIYLAIHGYTVSGNKETAKSELQDCDLTDINNFKPEIKSVIKEIMADSKKVKSTLKKENIEVKTEIKTDDVNE